MQICADMHFRICVWTLCWTFCIHCFLISIEDESHTRLSANVVETLYTFAHWSARDIETPLLTMSCSTVGRYGQAILAGSW